MAWVTAGATTTGAVPLAVGIVVGAEAAACGPVAVGFEAGDGPCGSDGGVATRTVSVGSAAAGMRAHALASPRSQARRKSASRRAGATTGARPPQARRS